MGITALRHCIEQFHLMVMRKWFLTVKLIDLFCIKSQEKRSVQRETEATLQAALRASEWDRRTKGENITAKVSI